MPKSDQPNESSTGKKQWIDHEGNRKIFTHGNDSEVHNYIYTT